MITLITGDNSFAIKESVDEIIAGFEGIPERFDGTTLELKQLPDILMGSSLFATKRLVILHNVSLHSALWDKLPEWLPRVSDDIDVVLVEAKPDKRTSAYKATKAQANVIEHVAWTERDTSKAEQWLLARAKQKNLQLEPRFVKHIVSRIGVDQWGLASAVDKLSLLDEVTKELIDETIDANPTQNVFQLFEMALTGNRQRVADALRTLELQEDPYAIFALLCSQVFSLAAIMADTSGMASKDFAIHPYVASKLSNQAKSLGKKKVAEIVQLFAQTDADMKSSKAEPWLLIERALYALPV